MTATEQAFRREIGLASKLDDALRKEICMALFLIGVLEKFLGDALGIEFFRSSDTSDKILACLLSRSPHR